MRLALTIYDDNGALEVASVDDCGTFVAGCYALGTAISKVMWDIRMNRMPDCSSTATYEGIEADIMLAVTNFGDLEDLPTVVSC